jgi:endonuclease/exonuclease/phosphatase family metal-dependent hydrolase
LPGEATRGKFSEMLNDKVDSLMKNTGHRARIIIAGDFNCSPEDDEILDLLKHNRNSPELINLSEKYSRKGEGSYRYMGTWEMLDQVIVSDWLVNCNSGINTSPELFRIFSPDFLLRKDSKYPGMSPFPTYLGYSYQGGYSDHLPVILDLRIKRVIQKQ